MAAARDKTENYFDEAYWDYRYTRDSGSFDWYQKYREIAPIIKMYIRTKDEVLMVGCGSALLSEDMVKDGYEKIMNIDISKVLIQVMTIKYRNMPQLQYKKMDVRYMKGFKDKSFACVLDKGTFDNLISSYLLSGMFLTRTPQCLYQCGAGAQACISSMLSEVYRVLKPGGKYFLISYGDPRIRMAYLKTNYLPWESITLHSIPRLNSRRSHEAYPLRKITEPIILQEDLTLGPLFNLDDPDLHFVYVCLKVGGRKSKPKPEEDPPLPMLRCKW